MSLVIFQQPEQYYRFSLMPIDDYKTQKQHRATYNHLFHNIIIIYFMIKWPTSSKEVNDYYSLIKVDLISVYPGTGNFL